MQKQDTYKSNEVIRMK